MSSTAGHLGHKSSKRSIALLLVEDSETDATLLKRALERGGFHCETTRVSSALELEAALRQSEYDVILCDHYMPGFSAPEALRIVQAAGIDVPFIIVSGHIEEQAAVAAMKAGAHDYVMKDRLARLVPAVERELKEAEMRRVQREYQDELKKAHEELEMRVQKRTAALQEAYQKLRRLLEERGKLENELLEIAENERRRIGFDLHDDLGQKMTGTLLMVKALEHKLKADKHRCCEDAAQIHSLIEEIVQHTHNLAHQFSSLHIQGTDLSSVLESLAQNVRKMFKVTCEFTAKGDTPDLPGNTMLQLHKIAQEAVSNAIKHGKASTVAVCLTCKDQFLTLTIRNNGVPFQAPSGPTQRMGLRIMNYRANTIGATLEIKPERHGTLVTCALPLHSSNGAGADSKRSAAQKPRSGIQRFSQETTVSERP